MAFVARNLYKLYVGNIPWTVGHNDLKQYFSKFGHVSTATVVFDMKTGLSKSYGFVVYSNREGFENAINFGAHKLEGGALKVEPAGSGKTTK
ncbi:hypothetical protein MML48_1g01343 [Holotrichia oblita]|uniref:Uncharacterized protein n=1 Tax=Holotrichia oblita TaxID=644536 RepID=A0ACB9TTX0_HOLOL|nr:hypothetical protein MML48_1g01343 [Holotrichia oblita]